MSKQYPGWLPGGWFPKNPYRRKRLIPPSWILFVLLCVAVFAMGRWL